MNVVVDASVAAKYLVPESDSDKAREMLSRWEHGQLHLHAPAILLAEIASMLWKRATRGLIPAPQAVALFQNFVQVGLPLAPIEDLVEPALKLAIRHRRSVYDALYVALAVREECELVTADERLQKAYAPAFPQVRLLRDWR